MNAETGSIYYGAAEIEAARGRGEELIELSDGIARQLTASERLVRNLGLPVERFKPDDLSYPLTQTPRRCR